MFIEVIPGLKTTLITVSLQADIFSIKYKLFTGPIDTFKPYA